MNYKDISELDKKTYKKQRKLYQKMNKKYRKELSDLIKNHYGPWDNFVGEFFEIQAKHWVEYYELGFNVWGMEICNAPEFNDPERPTRKEIAQELLRRYHNWVDFLPDVEVYKEAYGQTEVDGKPLYIHEMNREYNSRKRSFFDYYMKYAEDMWD